MRPSQALSSKRLSRFLNHPDSLTADQTQRFLNALQTSFRRNLDQEHDVPRSEHASTSPSTALHLSSGRQRPASDTQTSQHGHSARPTDVHFSNLLSSPLLRPPRVQAGNSFAKRDPMDVFDEAVARGLMTLRIAKGCLEAKRRLILKSDNSDLGAGAGLMDPSWRFETEASSIETWRGHNICDRVLQWLRACPPERRLEYLNDGSFHRLFVPFMVAEGKEELLWEWIESFIRSGDHIGKHPFHATARYILLLLSCTKATGAEKLDAAYSSIIRASDTYHIPEHEYLVGGPWRTLAFVTSSLGWQKPPPSAPVFDKYVALADRLAPSHRVWVACLHVHHPTSPSVSFALDYFKTLFQAETAQSSNPSGQAKPTPKSRHVLSGLNILGSSTIKYLYKTGEPEVAQGLLKDLHKFFVSNEWRIPRWLAPGAERLEPSYAV